MAEGDKVFVIMQVGGKDSPERKRADEIYDYIVKPALAQHKLKPYRADQDFSPGAITPKLLTELLDSRLVIADLTGRNPNVFYELGISHSFARPLISIADSVDSLPFDAKDERVIEVGNYPETGLTYAQGEDAKKSLAASLEIVLADGYVPPSPLREIAGTQSLDALAPENPFAAELGQIRDTLEEIRANVRPRMRSVIPAGLRSDLDALRGAIEAAVQDGSVDPSTMADRLITEHSTSDHDAWARALFGMAPDGDGDDPWGAPSSPTPDPTPPPWESPGTTAQPDPWAADNPPF